MSDSTANRGRCIKATLAAVALLSATGCQLFFPLRRNAKLRLLRGERMTGLSLIHPVVSPDGAQVYYFGIRDPYNIDYPYGTLWREGFDDTCAVQVLPDTFVAMAISPDGRTMVLSTTNFGASGRLVTVDLNTWRAETIPSTQYIDADDVEFSRTVAGRIYYTNRTGLHHIDVEGGSDVLVDSAVSGYFDLTASDSVVRTWLSKPKVSPDGRYVACVVSPDKVSHIDCDIAIVDMATGDTTWLRANPYQPAAIVFPYWTPNGQALVFAAAEWRGEPGGTYPAELWVLDDALKKARE